MHVLNLTAINLILSLILLGLLTLYGYFSNQRLSIGDVLESWHIGFDYFFNSLVAPIFIFFVSVICVFYGVNSMIKTLWAISIFFFIEQAILLAATNRLLYIRVKDWILSGCISMVISLIVSLLVSHIGRAALPSGQTIGAITWVLAIGALLVMVRHFLPHHFYDFVTQKQHILSLYKKYEKLYNPLLDKRLSHDAILKRIFFSILITEDLNRPVVFRGMERLFFRFKFINTTGVMQVTNEKYLSDKKSIQLAQEIITGAYDTYKTKESEYSTVRRVAENYNLADFYPGLIADAYYCLKEHGF